MDKNTLIGLLLIGAIMIGFSIWNALSDAEIARQKEINDSIAQLDRVKTENLEKENKLVEEKVIDSVRVEDIKEELPTEAAYKAEIEEGRNLGLPKSDSVAKAMYGPFYAAAEKKDTSFTVETEKLKLIFSSRGGRITKAVLKDYKTSDGRPLILFDSTSEFNLEFFSTDNKNIFTDEMTFESDDLKDIQLTDGQEKDISFKLKVSDDQYLEYIYHIKGDDYLIGFDVNLVGMDKLIDMRSGELYLNWMINAPSQERSVKTQRQKSTVYYKYKDDDVDDLGHSDEKEDFVASIKWVSFKQEFFNATLISDEHFDKSKAYAATVTDEGDDYYVKKMQATVTLPLSGSKVENFGMKMFLGPNKYDVLKPLDIGLEKVINLGWGIFGWINRFAVIPVFNFLDSFNWNYGIIILILTVLLKLVLSPITYKTYMSGAKMRVLKPEINEINEKYKDDSMKKQQATMSLYKQTGVNPLSGCIPMLIQMPILIAMFRFFPSSIELRQESFLWVKDLSSYDSIYNFPDGFSIPFYGDHISLFTILMAVSIFFYTKINGEMSMGGGGAGGAMASQMKMMKYLMPFMMLFFFNNYSAGLSYYYFLANIISIAQVLIIRKLFINEDAIRAKIEKNKKRPKANKKSGFQKRLEEMAKQKGMQQPKKKR